MRHAQSKSTIRSLIITQSIAILVFVVVPVVVTFMAPRTTIRLRRSHDQVAAVVTRHTLLIVPLYTTTMEPLLDADSILQGEKAIKEDRQRNRKATTQIATGSVRLTGNGQDTQVQSTYEDAPVQAQQIKAFIENPAAKTLTITANAPWMLTYVLGGVMTGFAALYGIGSLLAIMRFVITSMLPVGPDR